MPPVKGSSNAGFRGLDDRLARRGHLPAAALAMGADPVFPIAFTGPRLDRHARSMGGSVRRVHLAPDVNDGHTACGLDIAVVAAAGLVSITTPTKWPFLEGCVDCRRVVGAWVTGPKFGDDWSD